MCSATVGATPVNRCTVAASATFSYGSRGTPSCGNTLNLVPELPYAQEAVSIRWVRSASLTRDRVAGARSVMVRFSQLIVEIEHFGKQVHVPVRAAVDEEVRHFRLPACVDLGGVHLRERPVEVVGAQVADQQPVLAQEERVVGPPGVPQRGQHVRPDPGMAAPVLLQPLRLDLEGEADPAHAMPPS